MNIILIIVSLLSATKLTTGRVCLGHCSCYNTTVLCNKLNLVRLPFLTESQTTEYDLSQNDIIVLPDVLTNVDHLQILNLSNNKISFVSSRFLSQAHELQVFDLSANSIQHLNDIYPHVLLHYSPYLYELNLSYNRLKHLGSDYFLESISLSSLDVSNNRVVHLDELSISHLPNLTSLNLSLNVLKNFGTSTTLIKSNSLQILDLSQNRLNYLDEQSLMYLHRLKSIDLSYNYLPDLYFSSKSLTKLTIIENNGILFFDTELFSQSPNLTYLDMSKSDIQFLFYNTKKNNVVPNNILHLKAEDCAINKFNVFNNFPNVTKLELKGNLIKSINSIENQNLEYLDLSRNGLVYINISNVDNLKFLNLSYNKFKYFDLDNHRVSNIDLSNNQIEKFTIKHWSFNELEVCNLSHNNLRHPFEKVIFNYIIPSRLILDYNDWFCNCSDSNFAHMKTIYTDIKCSEPSNVTNFKMKSACDLSKPQKIPKFMSERPWLPMVIASCSFFLILIFIYCFKKSIQVAARVNHISNNSSNLSQDGTQMRPSSTHLTVEEMESKLPSYEEALLMPKPELKLKVNADTQTSPSLAKKVEVSV